MWSTSGPDNSAGQAIRRRQRPDNEIPVPVPVEVTLFRSPDIAVFICGLRAFRHGLDFTVEIRSRADGPDLGPGLHGHDQSGDVFLFGVEFADGQRCSNLPPLGSLPMDDAEGSAGPTLIPSGGGGSSNSADISYFLSPVPPPGDLTFVCAWPGRGVPESRAVLAAQPLVDASQRVSELWPWAPPSYRGTPHATPCVPDGGWFAALQRPERGR
jgi:hypothetical protein